MASDSVVPFVSVVVPCRNEVRHIRACLDSILAGDYPAERLEVLVADGASDDGTRQILDGYETALPGRPTVRVLDNPRRITPCALNTAIRAARGEIVVRVDAHAIYPPEYVRGLVTALQETGAEIVGARIETIPADDRPVSRAIALGMSHPFGVGPSRFRIGTITRRAVDHVPFFCCRRELFDRVGLFDEELVRNQDGEFSSRVRRSGGSILLIPDVVARYVARDTIGKLGRTLFQYGYFKPLTARKIGRVMTVRQLVPPTFVLALVGAGGLSTVSPVAAVALAACLGGYAAAVLACCLLAARRLPLRAALALAVVFPVMHVAYGYGYLRRTAELALRPVAAGSHDTTVIPLSR
jgi:glycosyltransferase involved in cell wall biosynthesis